ncbi:MAG: carboxypeptidase-like regulatory domain-containing protein, partial [Terriglobia bacterium]
MSKQLGDAASIRRLAVFLLLAFLGEGFASTAGRIYGSLIDPSGAMIGSATVTAMDEKTGREQTTISDPAGSYLFVNLPVGTYTITA